MSLSRRFDWSLMHRSQVERALPPGTASLRELMLSGQMHALYIPELA
jgi:hypothetical protein